MKVYFHIAFELIFLFAFVGSWLPYCFNQSSDVWFLIGVISVIILPVEVYMTICKICKMSKE